METEGIPYDCRDLSQGPVAWLVYVHDLRVCKLMKLQSSVYETGSEDDYIMTAEGTPKPIIQSLVSNLFLFLPLLSS